MTPKPVLVSIRTGKALFLGGLSGLIGVIWLGLGVAFWTKGSMEDSAIFIGGVICALILACSAHYFGVAIRKPVALRMDIDGISGYYADPATWPEIMAIEVIEGSKGQRYLGFAFLNPDIIGARQSFTRKVFNWVHAPFLAMDSRGARYQIIVPGHLLRISDIYRLAAEAETFRRNA